jgi:3-oxoacid CoA-transferase A subunit
MYLNQRHGCIIKHPIRYVKYAHYLIDLKQVDILVPSHTIFRNRGGDMKSKIYSLDDALVTLKDGDSVAMHYWGFNGTPSYLVRGLIKRGVKDLTLYINNFVPIGMSGLAEIGIPDLAGLLPQLKKLVSPFIGGRAYGRKGQEKTDAALRDRVEKGILEIESSTHGVLIERLLAGAMGTGGFYSPIGLNTVIDKSKERRNIDGKDYIFEKPVRPDIGLVKAYKADTLGNLVYRGTSRGSNPIIAMASRMTIVEVFDIVEPGELDPEMIVTPGIYVDRIVKIPEDDVASEKKITEIMRLLVSARAAEEHPDTIGLKWVKGART